jgi:hypothetical protein
MNRTHVIIRNTKVNAVRLIEVSDRGSFTETKMGSPFRKLNAEGRPVGIEVGDTLLVAQSGRGVIAECEVEDPLPAVRIATLEDLERLRREVKLNLSLEYWDNLRAKLLARPPGSLRDLFFHAIAYRCRRRLSPAEIFPLNLPRGFQNSWLTIDPSDSKGVLALRGKPQNTGDSEDLAQYGIITSKVRNLVFQVWGTSSPVQVQPDEALEYDHWIPKALGGPGIFVENVVPLPKRMNIRKSAHVGNGFPTVSRQVGLLFPEDEALDWGLFPHSQELKSEKARVVKRVTEQVRAWPVPRQKSFYFWVMAHTIQDLPERFRRAGLPVPEQP